MLARPGYFISDVGCLKLSNIIHNGQQVNKLGGFTCCYELGMQIRSEFDLNSANSPQICSHCEFAANLLQNSQHCEFVANLVR